VARFSRTLASLIRSGVPILEVLNIVANTCGNVIMEKAIRVAMETSKRVKESPPIIQTPYLPGDDHSNDERR